MAAKRIIRRLQDDLDVDPTNIGDGKVPVYRTNVSSHQYETMGGGGGGGGGINIAASNTTYTSGTVVLSGGANVTVGTNGQTITISAAAQTAQTQNLIDLTLAGNTAGVLALVSSGTLTLAGGTNVTLSQAGNAVTISGRNAATGISSIQASNTTYTSGGVIITGVGGGVTVSSNTGQRIDISVAAPVAQTAQTGISSIQASNTTYTSGGVIFTGVGGGVTVQSNTGQRVDISVASPVAQTSQTGISSIAASDATYTSGQVQFTGSNMVTVKSSAGQRVVIDATQTVQTQNLVDVTLSGNSTSAGAGYILVSSGTLTLAGGNNITLSQNGNALTISGANAAGAQTGISSIQASDATYTSGKVIFTGVGGGITVSSNTGQRVDLSVAAQTVQTQNVVVPAASNTTYTSGTFTITGVGGGVTVQSNTGQRVDISVAAPVAQTAQTQNLFDVSVSTTAGGGTAGTMALISSGTLSLYAGNNITLSQSATNKLVISGPNLATAISGLAGSDATYTSGTVTITGVGGGVTVSSNTGQRIDISVAAPVAQTVQTQNLFDVSVSTTAGGATAGTMALISSGTLSLYAGNNITLSQSATNKLVISGANAATGISGVANSQTTYTSGTVSLGELGAITIRSTTGNQYQFSVAAQSVQPAVGAIVGSDATYTSGSVTFTGVGGGVTVSSNTGQRVDISVAAPVAQTVQTQNLFDVSVSTTAGGATSGTMALISSGTLSLYAGNNITLSQSATNKLVISAANAATGVSGIANSQTTYTSGTVSLGELGAITIRSTTGNQYQFSVAAQTAQTGISGIANSQTTYTSGTVSLSELGAITIRSTTGNQYQLSVNAQTVQTQNLHNVTLSGNSTSAGAGYIQISSGTLTLAGGNNITLSQNGNAVTISAPNAAAAQTAISGLANSQTTYTSGTVSLSELGAITIRSTTGNQFQLSVNAQTAQTGVSGIANSQTTYTSGTVSLGELGAITIRSTTGNQYQFSVNSQTVQTQNLADVTLSGNTAGVMALVSSGTLTLAGGNNITVSQAGNAVTISGANPAAQTGISGVANSQTTYTSGTVSLSELGAITIRSTTGNQYQFSVAAQTVQTQNMVALSATNTLYSSGTVLLTGSNMVTVKSSAAGQTIIIDATQSVQTQNLVDVTLSGNSTSAGAGYILVSSGTLTLAGGNNITLSQAGNAVTISAANAGGAQTGISGLANSQTTYTSGTVSLSELGAITIRSTTGNQYQLSVNAQTVQTQNFVALSATNTLYTSGTVLLTGSNMITVKSSGAGQTIILDATQSVQTQNLIDVTLAGNSTSGAFALISSGTMTLAGGNNITLSQNGNAVTVSGAPSFNAGVSTDGNTAGATGVTGTRLVFVGSGPISLSQTTGAAGGTLSILGPATSVLSASSNITISTVGSTIKFSVPLATVSMWPHDPIDATSLQFAATQGIGASAATQTTVTAWVQPINANAAVAFNNLNLGANNTFTTATTSISSINFTYSQGASLGLYTLTGSTMSLSSSWSQSFLWSNATAANATNGSIVARLGYGGSSLTQSTQGFANMTNMTQSWLGSKLVPLNWTSVSNTVTAGQYWAVICLSALTAGNNQAALSQIAFNTSAVTFPQEMGKLTASVTSPFPFQGLATLVNSSNSLMPVSFNTSVITTATAAANSTNYQSVWMRAYSSHSN